MLGNTSLVYDEFESLTCQIENAMNSRPLYAIPGQPDYLALTPSHFISLREAKIPLNSETYPSKAPLTDKWLSMQKIYNDVWEKFKDEYLVTMQKRNKWLRVRTNLKVGDIVILKQPTYPIHWPLAKVVQVFPEGIVRTVVVKASKNVQSTKHVQNLVLLLSEEENEQSLESKKQMQKSNEPSVENSNTNLISSLSKSIENSQLNNDSVTIQNSNNEITNQNPPPSLVSSQVSDEKSTHVSPPSVRRSARLKSKLLAISILCSLCFITNCSASIINLNPGLNIFHSASVYEKIGTIQFSLETNTFYSF